MFRAGLVAYSRLDGILFKLETDWSPEADFEDFNLIQMAEYLVQLHPTVENIGVFVYERDDAGHLLRGWGHHAWKHREEWGWQAHPPRRQDAQMP